MTEKRAVVPVGMCAAARRAYRKRYGEDGSPGQEECLKYALEEALQWATENPQTPTKAQLQKIADEHGRGECYPESISLYVTGFQKLMWLAPESEVPEELHDLQWAIGDNPQADLHNKETIEAYRRGQKSKES